MSRFYFSLVIGLLFSINVVSAQSSSAPTLEWQGFIIDLPTNINTFTWENFSDAATTQNGYYGWARFQTTPVQSVQDDMKAAGIEVIHYKGNSTYSLYIPKAISPVDLQSYGVASIIPVTWDMKVTQSLRLNEVPSYAINGNKILVRFQSHTRTDDTILNAMIKSKGIEVLTAYRGHNLYELSIPDDCLEELASIPYVKWVEFIPAPPVKEDIRGRALHKSNGLDTQSINGNNYTGAGIGVQVRDDGVVGPHIDFNGRINNSATTRTGRNHGDGVAGIMAGAGNLDPTKRGMAAGANVFVTDYNSSFLGAETTALLNSGQVQITNSSYGDGCNGGYTTNAFNVDNQTHNNLNVLHVFSAGNSGTANCGYGAGSGWGNITGGHKQGKNVIATANSNYDGTLRNSSSRGPAYDGRIKPDITANGHNHQTTQENNQYRAFSGTSGAAPGVAGVSAQLYELYASFNNGSLPQAALVKAAMLNTATDYGNVGPDYKYGWGMLNGTRAGLLLENNRFLVDNLTQGSSRTHRLTIPTGATQVRFMLYWNDPAAAPGASAALINDLDIEVTTPGGTSLDPFILNPAPLGFTLDTPATTGTDRLNNVEQVVINNPTAGVYTIEVDGFNIPVGPQEYFIVYEVIEDELTVTYPNGDENMVPGEVETLHWDAVNTTANSLIEYSANNGASWNTVATVAAGSYTYDWTVPAAANGNSLIRITNGSFTDTSDSTFSIANQPTQLQFSQVCPMSVTLTWNAVPGADEYDVYLLGNQDMDLVQTVTTNSATVPIANGNNSIWAALVSRSTANGWESRRTIAENNDGLVNCTLANDIAIIQNNTSGDFRQACSSNSDVTISVQLQNLGTSVQNNLTLSYQVDNNTPVVENTTLSIAPGQVINYDYTTPYTVTANGDLTLTTSLNTSDQYLNNNQAVEDYAATATSLALGTEEDFELNGFLPSGWSLSNPDDDETWEQFDNVIGSDGTTTTAAYVNGAIYTDRGEVDTFTTLPFELNNSQDGLLTFDLAKAQWSATYNDGLRVQVSTDCGVTFNSVYFKDGLTLATVPYVNSNWTPSSAADWRIETIDLTAYVGNSVVLRFENLNDYSNATFIDNIRISDSTLSIDTDTVLNNIKLYPNPSSGEVTVAAGQDGFNAVTLHDVQGRKILEYSMTTMQTSYTVNLTELRSAVYFMRVSNDNAATTIRVIKK